MGALEVHTYIVYNKGVRVYNVYIRVSRVASAIRKASNRLNGTGRTYVGRYFGPRAGVRAGSASSACATPFAGTDATLSSSTA